MKTVSVAFLAGIVGCAFVQPAAAAEAGTFKERVVHSFADTPDGAEPEAGLVDVKGTLFGTTFRGGAHNGGTVFSLDLGTGTETVLYSFCSAQNCTDGFASQAGLIDVKGILYGTTSSGGTGGQGTVISIVPSTGAESVVYSFCSRANCADGAEPLANLIAVKGKLYGTTLSGGAHNLGTVFAIDRSTGAEKVLYSFAGGTDGENPDAGLIDVNGVLYGTTSGGGKEACYSCGTVFSLDLTTGAETVLYSFCSQQDCTDGEGPGAGLVDVNGILYGTTVQGGGTGCQDNGCGTVFSLDPATGTETVLHAFAGADGENPEAGLIAVNGVLYGTTYGGGRFGGTAFSLDPSTGAETVLHSFCVGHRPCDGDGYWPQAGLLDVHGTLYGTTTVGGAVGPGTVFSLKEKRR